MPKRHNYQPMAHRKKKTSSSTPGKTKGARCTAKPEHKVMCKRNRSWKSKNYGRLMENLSNKT